MNPHGRYMPGDGLVYGFHGSFIHWHVLRQHGKQAAPGNAGRKGTKRNAPKCGTKQAGRQIRPGNMNFVFWKYSQHQKRHGRGKEREQMEEKTIKSYMDAWPAWLSKREIEKITEAVKGDRDGAAIVAACLYLGMKPEQAAGMTTGRAYGDALQNRTKKAFLRIPDEYRRMIEPPEERPDGEKTRIAACKREQAGAVIERVFIRAGLSLAFAAERLRRTAAALHFMHEWTPTEQIELWFADEIKQARPGEPGAAYYRLLATEEQEQAIADAGIIRMGGILTGTK